MTEVLSLKCTESLIVFQYLGVNIVCIYLKSKDNLDMWYHLLSWVMKQSNCLYPDPFVDQLLYIDQQSFLDLRTCMQASHDMGFE